VPDGKLPLYDNPDWAKGFDIVVHNECWADGGAGRGGSR